MYKSLIILENPLDRVKLLMNYDMSTTKTENVLRIQEQGGSLLYNPSDPNSYYNPTTQGHIESSKERERQNSLKQSFDEKFIAIKIPPNYYGLKELVVPKGTVVEYFSKDDNLQQRFFKKYFENPNWARYVPKEEDLKYLFPENTAASFRTPDDKLYKASIQRLSDNPLKHRFLWYYDEENNAYDQSKILGDQEIPVDYLYDPDGFWEKWGSWILAGLSVLVATIVPPPAGIWLSVGIDLIQTAEDLSEENYPGAVISFILAFLPVAIAKIPNVGTISQKEAQKLADLFANAKNEGEIVDIYKNLGNKEKMYFRTVFSQDPHKIMNEINNVMWNNIINGLQTGQYTAKELVTTINNLIGQGQLKYDDVVKWYQKANVKRFGVDLGATGLVIGGAYVYGKTKESEIYNTMQSSRKKGAPITKEEDDEFMSALKDNN